MSSLWCYDSPMDMVCRVVYGISVDALCDGLLSRRVEYGCSRDTYRDTDMALTSGDRRSAMRNYL